MTIGTGIAVFGVIWAIGFLVSFAVLVMTEGRAAIGMSGIAISTAISAVLVGTAMLAAVSI